MSKGESVAAQQVEATLTACDKIGMGYSEEEEDKKIHAAKEEVFVAV